MTEDVSAAQDVPVDGPSDAKAYPNGDADEADADEAAADSAAADEAESQAQLPGPPSRPANVLLRCLVALVVVWVISWAVSLVHLTGPVALIWIIATVVLVPIGSQVSDRLVALLLLAAAPAVLIAWFTPFVPILVSPAVLTGLLGTLPALAWGLGWTRRPGLRAQDVVTLGLAAITAAIYWIPFMRGGFVRAVGILGSGFDIPAHYALWRSDWANHGYTVFNTLSDPDAREWRVYPQGAHAILADVATVITGDSQAPAQVNQSITLFAILFCLLAGVLALVTAWSVDRLSRSAAVASRNRVVVFQVLAVLLVAIGPGSPVMIQSVSFAAGLCLVIPALALAATASRSPRLAGLLVAAALVASAPVYPICALLAVVLWPIYLWSSRGYWLASKRQRWLGLLATFFVAALCSPVFIVLVTRHLHHNWDTGGYFQPLNKGIYAGIAILLAVLIVLAQGRLPRAIEVASWGAATVSIALLAEGIYQWVTAGDPTYYTVKTMYLAWILAVIAVGAGLACIHARPEGKVFLPRPLLIRLTTVVTAFALIAGSLLTGLLLAGISKTDPTSSWRSALSKEGTVIFEANSGRYDTFGSFMVGTARYAAQHPGISVVAPCNGAAGSLPFRWMTFLNGGMDATEMGTMVALCGPSHKEPLGTFPAFVKDHPEIHFYLLALNPKIYDYTLLVKAKLNLSNLTVEDLAKVLGKK